jgi:hypothetical protein
VSNGGSICHLGLFEMVSVLTWPAGHDRRTRGGGAYAHNDRREGQQGIRAWQAEQRPCVRPCVGRPCNGSLSMGHFKILFYSFLI